MAQSHVQGVRNLRKVARYLREASSTDLRRELDKGLVAAVKPLAKDVHAGVGRYIPSGFAPTLERDLRVSAYLRVRAGRVTVRASARGRKALRDLSRMDRGVLRHPVFGNRDHWVAQAIKPGFFSTPSRRLRGDVTAEASAALGRIAERIGKA